MTRSPLALAALLALLVPASTATHAGTYELEVIVQQPTAQVDVFVVPPERGLPTEALAALDDGFADVHAGIDAYGASWLTSGLDARMYVLGRDAVPEGTEPEVVIVTTEVPISVAFTESDTGKCVANLALPAAWSEEEYRRLRFVMMHEYVHCLGAGHVSENEPVGDLMNGAFVPSEACMSNLDVRAVEGAFARALGRPSAEWISMAVVPVADYARPC